jgi:hypothetical protein
VARVAYGVGVGLLASLLIAPTTTEFAGEVAVLGALTIASGARPLLDQVLPAAVGARLSALWSGWRPGGARGRASHRGLVDWRARALPARSRLRRRW